MESTVSINDIPDISCFIYRLFNYIEKLNSNKNRMHITFGKQFTIYNFPFMLIQLSCYEEDIPKDLKIMEHNKHEDNYLHHLTCDIVVAYLSGNTIPFSDVPLLIQQIYRALAGVEMDVSDDKELVPAVPIKKSVFPDYIICLEDGKKVKMLKRHLMSAFGLTPSAYRQKWGLPANYPMVAPAYSEQRSRLARSLGLGNNKSQEITELQHEKSEEDAIVTRLPEVKRGRKKKLG